MRKAYFDEPRDEYGRGSIPRGLAEAKQPMLGFLDAPKAKPAAQKAVTSLFDDPQGIDWWNLQEPSSALHALAKQAGYMGNLFDQTTTTDDLGHNQTMRTPNAAAIEALKGYTAGEQYRSGNSAMRDITGPNGQSAGSQSFGDMSRGGLAEQLTPLVMAGMTGAGLYGAFGGAGGLSGFGGAGGEADRKSVV